MLAFRVKKVFFLNCKKSEFKLTMQCLLVFSYTMRLGTSSQVTKTSYTITLRVVNITRHPQYSSLGGVYFDAGIAIPEKPIVFTNYIR